jgi:hypothetical protein
MRKERSMGKKDRLAFVRWAMTQPLTLPAREEAHKLADILREHLVIRDADGPRARYRGMLDWNLLYEAKDVLEGRRR